MQDITGIGKSASEENQGTNGDGFVDTVWKKGKRAMTDSMSITHFQCIEKMDIGNIRRVSLNAGRNNVGKSTHYWKLLTETDNRLNR